MKTSTITHWEKKIEHAIALSHDDPYGERDVRTVAAMIAESYDNFSHKFVEMYGESYVHFAKRRRLEAGAGYLPHSDFSVKQVAEMCGYTHSSFTRGFRELYNESPVSFRDRLYLPNEAHTLAETSKATTPHNDPQHLIFSTDRTLNVGLPDYILYYNILPQNNNPVKSMVEYMDRYQQQLHTINAVLQLSGAMVITGTLDVVPVTSYSKMMMYAGILVPQESVYDRAHRQIQLTFQESHGLYTKMIPGGSYKKLPVPMSFVAAGLPMYQFINTSCRSGYFKMSGNHFFISLTGIDHCEIFIPWQKR
ncbi:helix-turn-helix transcriptional regulator [Chitinophaga polysaccharea]|uniref:helix-turn-helix transcriptional regulator n=1 Tax=Chitinophaga polysaccharea TaxID=1293035 RepID=UPI00145574E5|nr:AraC family transcriptional regulator [Chitinophaga polysaccharea]NLR61984.1 helix-turn-helix transcriptional regulator [Chitinophaga polysaccharea]